MSWQARAANLYFRYKIKNRRGEVDIAKARKRLERLALRIPPPHPNIQLEDLDTDGVPLLKVVNSTRARRFLFYIHGGAYCICSPRTHRPILTRLAWKAGAVVLAPDYRLAPEHPYPAALEDVIRAWNCVTRTHNVGQMVLGGDSAGGGLVFSLLAYLAQSGQPMPAAAFGLSAWTDLTMSGNSIKLNAVADPMFKPKHLHYAAGLYLKGHDATDPLVSPLFAPMKGYPPCLLQVADTEVLKDDTTRLAEKLRQAGIPVDLEIWARMPHVWQAYVGQIPEAAKALDKVAEFMRERVPFRDGSN